MEGTAKYHDYIVTKDSPVIKFEKGQAIPTEDTVLKDAIVKAKLEVRDQQLEGKDKPSRLVLLHIEKYNGYIIAKNADMYVSDLPDSKPESGKKGLKKSIPDNAIPPKARKKNMFLKFGLPIGFGVIGFVVAKKKGLSTGKILLVTALAAGVGYLPYYVSRPSAKLNSGSAKTGKKKGEYILAEDYETVDKDLNDVTLKAGRKVIKKKDRKVNGKSGIETVDGYMIPMTKLK